MNQPLSNISADLAAFLLDMREKGYVAAVVLLDMNNPEHYKLASNTGDEKHALELLRIFIDGIPHATNKTTQRIKLDKVAT